MHKTTQIAMPCLCALILTAGSTGCKKEDSTPDPFKRPAVTKKDQTGNNGSTETRPEGTGTSAVGTDGPVVDPDAEPEILEPKKAEAAPELAGLINDGGDDDADADADEDFIDALRPPRSGVLHR